MATKPVHEETRSATKDAPEADTRIEEIGEIPEPPTPVIDYPDPIISAGGAAHGDAHTSEPFIENEEDLKPSLISPPSAEPIEPPE